MGVGSAFLAAEQVSLRQLAPARATLQAARGSRKRDLPVGYLSIFYSSPLRARFSVDLRSPVGGVLAAPSARAAADSQQLLIAKQFPPFG